MTRTHTTSLLQKEKHKIPCSWGDYRTTIGSRTNLSCRQKCCPCKDAPIFWSVNWAAALLHLVNSFATLGLWATSDSRDHIFNLSETSAPWTNSSGTNGCTTGLPPGAQFSFQVSDDYCISRVNKITSSLSLWWLVIVFHFLSFGFQAAAMVQWDVTCCRHNFIRKSYVLEVTETGINVLRFIEYSISATLMQIAIALILGIWDRLTIIGIAFLTVVTMLLGLIAEQLKNDRKDIAWLTHFTGWFSLGGVWAIIGRQFIYTLQTSGDILPPTFVYIIVGVITLLYSGFGIIQFVQIYNAGPGPTNNETANDKTKREDMNKGIEMAYCVNSLTSKSFLGWIIFANALAGMAQS